MQNFNGKYCVDLSVNRIRFCLLERYVLWSTGCDLADRLDLDVGLLFEGQDGIQEKDRGSKDGEDARRAHHVEVLLAGVECVRVGVFRPVGNDDAAGGDEDGCADKGEGDGHPPAQVLTHQPPEHQHAGYDDVTGIGWIYDRYAM